MPFGEGGNKNPKGWNGKPFAEALRMEISAAGKDHKALRKVAKGLLAAGAEGNVQAVNTIRDTLDGKPAQALQHTGEDGGPIKTDNTWKVEFVNASGSEEE